MSVKPCITCQITLGWNQRNLNFMEFLCDSYPPPACDVGFTTIVTPNDLDSWGDFYIHMIYGLDNEFPLKRDGFPKVMLTCWRVYHTHTYIYIYHISYIIYFTSIIHKPFHSSHNGIVDAWKAAQKMSALIIPRGSVYSYKHHDQWGLIKLNID